MSFFQNARKPVGIGGRLMVKGMNAGAHAGLAKWGLSHLNVRPDARVLDAGCGGGANVSRLLRLCPDGKVFGLDYSDVSVTESRKVNRLAIAQGRCRIIRGDVSSLPFEEKTLDVVTAFETVYFWPDMERAMSGIYSALKPGGVFLVCNESNGHDKNAVRFSQVIDGMKLYDKRELEGFLKRAGFSSVHTDERGVWICVWAVR